MCLAPKWTQIQSLSISPITTIGGFLVLIMVVKCYKCEKCAITHLISLKHFDYMFCWVVNFHTYMSEYIKTIYKN